MAMRKPALYVVEGGGDEDLVDVPHRVKNNADTSRVASNAPASAQKFFSRNTRSLAVVFKKTDALP